MEGSPPQQLNDQQLVALIQEINATALQKPQDIFKAKPILKAQGLESALKLCQIVYQVDTQPMVKYLVFQNLSGYLHPQAPPEFLNSIIQQFIPIFMNETQRGTQIGLCRCITTAVYHLLNLENFASIFELLTSLEGPNFILFLCELQQIITRAFDVPMLADKNFLLLTNIYATALPTIIDIFYQSPDQETFDLLHFLLINYQEPPLGQLYSYASFETFDINEFRQNIQLVFNSKLPEILQAVEQILTENADTNRIRFLLDFFSETVQNHFLQPEVTGEILVRLYQVHIDGGNINSFCEMLKNIFFLYPNLVTVEVVDFLMQMACALAQTYDLQNCKTVINIFPKITQNIFEPNIEHRNQEEQQQQPAFDPTPIKEKCVAFVKTILPLLIRQYPKPPTTEQMGITVISMKTQQPVEHTVDDEEDDDDDDEEEKYDSDLQSRNEIIEALVYISQPSFLECIGVIAELFKALGEQGQADYYVCEWILKLLNQYLILISDLELQEEFTTTSKLAEEIIKTPLVGELIQKYPTIAEVLCDIFKKVEDKDMALQVFNACLFNFSDDDFVMEAAIDLAIKYQFDILSEIQQADKLSSELIQLLVQALPSPSYLAKAEEFIQSEDSQRNKEAADIIKGLLSSNLRDFDITPFVTTLMQKQLYLEALETCYVNPDLFLAVLSEIGSREFEAETRKDLIETALKSAALTCFGPISEIVLSLIRPEETQFPDIVDLVADLFQNHKLQTIDQVETVVVSDESLAFLLSLIDLKFKDSSISIKIAEKLLDSLYFYFERVYPALTDEIWLTLIDYFTCEKILTERPSLSDLFFAFAKVDITRFHNLFVAVVSQITNNAEELFAYLVEEMESDKTGTSFQTRFACAIKAIAFYKIYS